MWQDPELDRLREEKRLATEAKKLARGRLDRRRAWCSEAKKERDAAILAVDNGPLLEVQEAKSRLVIARKELRLARASHDRVRKELTQAQKDYEAARDALSRRFEEIHEEKREIARRAGVEPKYLESDDFKVSRRSDGQYDILFCGVSDPNDRKHGHYVVKVAPVFEVTWRREPKLRNADATSQNE